MKENSRELSKQKENTLDGVIVLGRVEESTRGAHAGEQSPRALHRLERVLETRRDTLVAELLVRDGYDLRQKAEYDLALGYFRLTRRQARATCPLVVLRSLVRVHAAVRRCRARFTARQLIRLTSRCL